MTSYPNPRSSTLSTEHRRMLEDGSAILGEVLEEDNVRTITNERQLSEGFSGRQRQRGPGILFAVTRPNGEMSYSFRPDASDPKNPGHKYEQPCKALGGPGNVLGVPAGQRHLVDDVRIPVIFVEGIKKMLSIVSAARRVGVIVLVVAISGVWNWLSGGKPIADMLDIPVEGREVYIGFDSDVFRNPDVSDAARRLRGHLIGRGAVVYLSYLTDGPHGSKTGADDFLAAGHTYGEYMDTMRPYDAAELQAERLSRDMRLRLALEDLERRFWRFDWSGMGPHSARDVALKLLEAAWMSGKVVADGVRVTKAWGPLEVEAKVARQTLSKALDYLEEWGIAYKVKEPRKPGKAGAFVLRADIDQYGGGKDVEARRTPNGLPARAPRLRWSSPRYKPRRGLVSGTRKIRQSPPGRPRPAVRRLGKIRGAILDHLDRAGGVVTVDELYDALHPNKPPEKRRPRDLRRRKNPETEKGRDGLLIMLEEAGILTLDGDTVSLRHNWLDALDVQRRLGKETDTVDVTGRVEAGADTLAQRALDLKRKQYREYRTRHKRRKSTTSPASLEAVKHSREKQDAHLAGVEAAEKAQRPTSALAVAIRDYLDTHPADARQPAGWIGSTLWAHDLHPSKPTPAHVKTAIKELGGAAYLDGLLKRAGRPA